jgi:hypothetical protein
MYMWQRFVFLIVLNFTLPHSMKSCCIHAPYANFVCKAEFKTYLSTCCSHAPYPNVVWKFVLRSIFPCRLYDKTIKCSWVMHMYQNDYFHMLVNFTFPPTMRTCCLHALYANFMWKFEFKTIFPSRNDGGGNFIRNTQRVEDNSKRSAPSHCTSKQ